MLYARFNYPDNGWPAERGYAERMGLKVGERYEVEFVSMGGSYTSIYLKNIDGTFNSVLFDFETSDGTEVNIYHDDRYSPYARCRREYYEQL